METETQRNYKKQMKEIQKTLRNRNQDQYFSYIENDHISNYYSPKKNKTKRKISVSIFTLVIIIASFIYYILPALNNIKTPFTNGRIPISDTDLNNINTNDVIDPFANKQKQISDFVQIINDKDNKVNQIMDYINSNIIINLDEEENQDLIKYLDSSLERITALTDDIINISEPFSLKEYKATILDRYELHFKHLNYYKSNLTVQSNETVAKINQTIEEIRYQSEKEKSLLLKAFDEVGITYEIDNQGIHYKYRK